MEGRRKALIVANDEYDHDGLRRLRSAAADAAALAGVLGDPNIGGFAVDVARNEPAHDVGARIEDLFSEGRPDDVLLLHLSCHGLKDESGELYFATRNTRPNRLGSSAVSANFVQRCMRASRSRSIVLLLDCCYGGAFSQGVTVRGTGDANEQDSFPVGRLGGGRGRAVITASSSIEYAFEGDRLADDGTASPSVFTAALVEGLATGDADRDEDGWVSLNELYEYVFDTVRERNPHQTPGRDVEMQGELYLARSRRRRIRPQAVPADLQAAITDSNMFTRLGAVTELRARLIGDNLAAAVGAYAALTEIASTDLRYVAEAARSALDEAAIRLGEPALHFGRMTRRAGTARRSVSLAGPPVARECTFEPSDPWIRVEPTEDGFAVSVDTTDAGAFDGHVTIRCPTGETVVPVQVEVVADVAAEPEPAPPPADVKPPDVPKRPPVGATRLRPADRPPPEYVPSGPPIRHWRWADARRWLRDRRSWAFAAGVAVLAFAILIPMITGKFSGSDSGDTARPGAGYPRINGVAFSPDGKALASAGDHGTIRLWNPATGKLLAQPFAGNGAAMKSVAFSPDGILLASAGADLRITLRRSSTGRAYGRPLTGHTGTVNSVAFSPDGKRLASAGDDGTVRLWDPATGQPVGRPLTGHTGRVTTVAFSPDGKRLASGGDDKTVRLWDPATGRPVDEPFVSGDTAEVIQVAFSPDGKWLASTSETERLQLWYPTTGDTLIPDADDSNGIRNMAFSPDGRFLAGTIANAGLVRLWNPATWDRVGPDLTGHGDANSLAFSADGKVLAVGTVYDNIHLWNPATGQAIRELSIHASPTAAAAPATTGP